VKKPKKKPTGPERMWCVVDGKNYVALETTIKEDAETNAKDWNRLCPDSAPHIVVEYVRVDLVVTKKVKR
jgi:hypothetical protein